MSTTNAILLVALGAGAAYLLLSRREPQRAAYDPDAALPPGYTGTPVPPAAPVPPASQSTWEQVKENVAVSYDNGCVEVGIFGFSGKQCF